LIPDEDDKANTRNKLYKKNQRQQRVVTIEQTIITPASRDHLFFCWHHRFGIADEFSENS